MYILLAAATTFEIQPTIDFLAHPDTRDGIPETIPLITGVGPLLTTWSLMRRLNGRRPDLILQAGIAGAFPNRPPGDTFAIREDSLADLGVWEDQRFKTVFDLRLADPDHPPFTHGRLVNPYEKLLTLSALPQVAAITVNEITTGPDRIRWYQQNTAAVVESMEGGALHYVCLQEKIPFLQLRSVSNDIGVRDKSKWDIPLAIGRLNQQLIRLLQQLNNADHAVLQPIIH